MLVVQKYGGSSVGTPEKIRSVAGRIARLKAKGAQVVVVVSAMGDTTDDLIELAHKVTPHPDDREMDMLLSVGERISIALLSMALRDLKVDAISFTGSQSGIITDESHRRAQILEIRPGRIIEELAKNRVVIVAGFQGVSRTKEITTLGRGGSDTTAVALGAGLKADRCEVLTDVSGIFSADPRVVSQARRYSELSLETVYEMAACGAQVMHCRSIEIARARGMALWVGHSAKEEEGTMVTATSSVPSEVSEAGRVVSVVAKRGLKKLSVAAAQVDALMSRVSKERVPVFDMRLTDQVLELIVDPADASSFIAREGAAATTVTAITLVGFHLQQNPSVAAGALETMKTLKMPVAGLTVDPRSIKIWLIDGTGSDNVDQAVRELHARFIS